MDHLIPGATLVDTASDAPQVVAEERNRFDVLGINAKALVGQPTLVGSLAPAGSRLAGLGRALFDLPCTLDAGKPKLIKMYF